MTIQEARRLLTNKEMEKVTERALSSGAFSIERVNRKHGRLEVSVKFQKTGEIKVLDMGD